jgi:RNA recognition motif. (a.k.a. RRM, RBD, or RNP domain)
LSIKGAGSTTKGNVVEVGGLVAGTTAEDVAAIFKRCGEITNSKTVSGDHDVCIRLTFKTSTSAFAAVQKFNNQPADGKVLSVRIVGSTTAGTALGGRLGGADGLGLVREEGSVDVLMDLNNDSGSLVLCHATSKVFLLTVICQENAFRLSITCRSPCNHSSGSTRHKSG